MSTSVQSTFGVAPSTRPAPQITLLRPTRTADSITLTRLVRVELRKFVDTRVGQWLLGLSLAGALIIGIVGIVFFEQVSKAMGPSWMSIGSVIGSPLNLVVPVMVVLLFTSEWGQRTTMTTFAVEPRRARVLAAKGVVAALVTLAMWIVQQLTSAGAAALGGAMSGVKVDWTISAATLLGSLATFALMVACAAGFGLVAMNSAAAIVAFVAAPMLFGMIGMFGGKTAAALQWLNLNSATTPLMTGSWAHQDGWKLLTSSLLWVALPVTAGVIRTLRREAN